MGLYLKKQKHFFTDEYSGKKIYGHKIFSISEILDEFCKKTEYLEYRGIKLPIRNSEYLKFIFSEHACSNDFRCVFCKTKASHFRIIYDKFSNRYHLNLYGFIKQGGITKYIMFNRDHIIPKANNGSDTINNYQLTCSSCNHMRGNMSCESSQDIENISEYIKQQNLIKEQKRINRNKNIIDSTINHLLNKAKKKNHCFEANLLKEISKCINAHKEEIISSFIRNNPTLLKF